MSIWRRRQARPEQGNRRAIVALGDTHAGHKLGLCHPEVELTRTNDAGDAYPFTPPLTETQGYLWKLYQEHQAKALEFIGGPADLLVHGGDAIQGTKYANGLMDVGLGEQVEIAKANMEPWLDRAKRIRFVSGTPSHVQMDKVTAGALVASKLGHPDTRAAHHLRIEIGGVLFDIAHHGPGAGSREWLEGNMARYYLRSRALKDINKLGVEPAAVYVRFHHHVWRHEPLEVYVRGQPRWCHLVIVPSYCGLSDH